MKIQENIQALICALVAGPLGKQELNRLVMICHGIAVVAVRSRVSTIAIETRYPVQSHSDLAYDCIAELFRQDERGCLTYLRTYFEGLDLARTTGQEALISLRRIVVGRVNFGIFRQLNEMDPQLGRIIRNVKLAAQGLQSFTILERFGDLCLAPTMCDTLEHLPTFDYPELESALAAASPDADHVPALLAALSRVLRAQESRSRIVPVVKLALVIRSHFARDPDPGEKGPQADDNLLDSELAVVITDVCRALHRDVGPRYIDRGKLSEAELEMYMAVVREALHDRYAGSGADNGSLFDRLRQLLPDLERAEYRTRHRARLEYLHELAHERASARLRKEYP